MMMKRTRRRGGRRSGTTTRYQVSGVRCQDDAIAQIHVARTFRSARTMKYKYSKYTPSLLDELDMDELMSKLSDLMLSSGFANPWGDPSDDHDRTMQALHDAILEALFSDGVLPPDLLEKLFGDPADGDQESMRQQVEELIQQIIERMQDSGYITPSPDLD